MTSCLWLFPSGTAATVTFTVCATRLVHGTGNVVEEVGGVPVGQGRAHHVVPAQDPGAMRRESRREEAQVDRGLAQLAGYGKSGP